MSKRYTVVQNFRYGLDGRKSVLTSQPGTLIQCLNGFINAGGEIEQRMSFVKDANLYPDNTFGLQDTDTGLQTYGSAAAAGGTLPTGVTYVQLAHPTGYVWSDPEIVAATMIAVVFSTNYLGKAFVIARWNDQSLYCYYNGALVKPSRSGLVLNLVGGAEAPANLSTDLAALVDLVTSWDGTENVTPAGAALNGSTMVKSPPGVHFSPVVSSQTNGGIIASTLIDQNNAGTAAVGAKTHFTLTGGASGSVTVTAPATKAGTGTAQLSGGAVAYNTSLNQTATDVAAAINLYSGTTGYSASASGATVTVYAPAEWGNVTFNLTVTTVDLTQDNSGSSGTSLTLVLNPLGLNLPEEHTTRAYMHGTINASSSGGDGAVTYAWSECNADGSAVTAGSESGITMSSTTGATVSFSNYVGINQSILGYFKCVATDTNPTSVTLYFTVYFENNSIL